MRECISQQVAKFECCELGRAAEPDRAVDEGAGQRGPGPGHPGPRDVPRHGMDRVQVCVHKHSLSIHQAPL